MQRTELVMCVCGITEYITWQKCEIVTDIKQAHALAHQKYRLGLEIVNLLHL